MTCHVFYDQGSALSFIKSAFAKKMGLKKLTTVYLQVTGVNHMAGLIEERDMYELTFFLRKDGNLEKKSCKTRCFGQHFDP